MPGFDVHSWTALFAPASTPQPVTDRLNAAVREIWDQTEVQKRLRDLGAEPAAGSGADLGAFVASETEKWRERRPRGQCETRMSRLVERRME